MNSNCIFVNFHRFVLFQKFSEVIVISVQVKNQIIKLMY